MGISKKTKTGIVFGLISGLIYTLIMFGFDMYCEEPIKLNKYLFYFISTSIINGTIVSYFAIKNDN